MTPNQKRRRRWLLAEKIHRLAYELEHDAARSRGFVPTDMSETLRDVSSKLGTLARRMTPD